MLKHFFISPLHNSQDFASIFSPKPAGTNITIPEDLLQIEIERPAHQSPSVPVVQPAKAERIFYPIIVKAATEHEIDPALIKAIIMAESGYNPNAISKKGAAGLMQLMPATAEALGVEDVFDPEHNINGGVMYFKYLVDHFKGDVKLALAAYNAGITKVKMYQGIPPFKATRYFINKVFEYHEHYRKLMTMDTGSDLTLGLAKTPPM